MTFLSAGRWMRHERYAMLFAVLRRSECPFDLRNASPPVGGRLAENVGRLLLAPLQTAPHRRGRAIWQCARSYRDGKKTTVSLSDTACRRQPPRPHDEQGLRHVPA